MTVYLPITAIWWYPEAHRDGPRRVIAPAGLPVHAVVAGRVTGVDAQAVGTVVVRDDHERFHHYRRLQASSISVRVHDEIAGGTLLGVIARPSDGSAPALLYGMHDADERWIDASALLLGAADPSELGIAADLDPLDDPMIPAHAGATAPPVTAAPAAPADERPPESPATTRANHRRTGGAAGEGGATRAVGPKPAGRAEATEAIVVIICRRCLTRNDEEATACTECHSSLTGDGGIRTGQPMRRDWDSDAGSEPRPPDVVAPPPPDAPPTPVSTGVTDGPPADPAPARDHGLIELPSEWRSTADDGVPAPAVEPRSPPAERFVADEPAARAEPLPADSPRRGRRPGEQAEVAAEPDTYSGRFRLGQAEPLPARHVADDAPAYAPGASAGARVPAPISSVPGLGGHVVTAVDGAPLAAGMVACRKCRRTNAESLRFCRFCGTTLPAFDIGGVEVAAVPRADPWWRRIIGTTKTGGRDGRTFGQRMRDSGQRRLKYRAKYTLETKLRALGFIAGGAGALFLVLGPVRSRVTDLLNPPAPVPVAAVGIDGTPAVADVYGPENANDEDRATALVLPFTGEPVSFTFDLEADTDPDELEFVTGFPNDDEQGRGPLFNRPATMEVKIGDETITVELDDHEGGQRTKVDIPSDALSDGATATVTILSVHDRAWDTYDRVAIAEIAIVG